MDHFKLFQICVYLIVYLRYTTPLPFPDKKLSEGQTYTNCDNIFLVDKLKSAGIPYTCFQNADDKVKNHVKPAVNSVKPHRSDEDKENTSLTECPNGYTFIPERNDCVINLPDSIKCEEGYVFDLDKEECLPDTKAFSVNSKHKIPQDADEEIITTLKCKSGTVYSPQVNLCLPARPDAMVQPPEIKSIKIAFVPHPKEGCPKGSVFSPEVDHCLKIHVPPNSKRGDEEIETKSSENVTQNEGKKSSQSKRTASDPTQIALEPLTHEAVGWDMCKPGEVYVSEIDLCLRP